MRAVELRGDRRLALVDRPDPIPGPDDVLIAPDAVGICATDIEIFDGVMAYYRTGQADYPVIAGHEWSGTVVRTGERVTGFAPGQRVVGEVSLGCGTCAYCTTGRYHVCADARETGIMGRDGAFATRLVHPARATFVVPPDVTADAAALIEPTSVALYAARRGRCAGRRVMVMGMGTIGLLALQCARAEGAGATIAANPSSDRLELARELGADLTLRVSSDGSAADLRAQAGTVDVVLVCTGAPRAIGLAVELVEPTGTVVLVGLTGEERVAVDIDRMVTKDLEVQAVNGSPGLWPDTVAAVASGAVETARLATHHYRLSEAEAAFALVRERPAGMVKALIHPQQ